MTVASKNK